LNNLKANIPVNPNVTREDDTCTITIWAAGDEFVKYNSINAPSLSIIEEHPIYTNITNGLGLFSSRFYYTYSRVLLYRAAVDSLKYSPITSDLNFYAY